MVAWVLGHLRSDPRYAQEPTRSLAAEYDLDQSSVLGTGITGCVRLVTHRHLGTTHAVKTLSKPRASERQLQEFKSEVDIQLSFNHPHVAKLERVFESGREIHLVMEHLKGGELFDHVLRRGRFNEVDGAEAMRQMLIALAHLHDNGCVHLDAKLENFVYETDACERLKLIDFGYATKLGDGKLSRVCGTPGQMAPEVLRGAYDCSADIWSLGVTAYMMLCGNSPWPQNDAETRRLIIAGRPTYRADFSNLSAPAQDFVRSLLTADPAARPTAQSMLNHSWLAAHATPALCPSMCCNDDCIVTGGLANLSDGESTTADISRCCSADCMIASRSTAMSDAESTTADISRQTSSAYEFEVLPDISTSTSTGGVSQARRQLLVKILPALKPLLMRRFFCGSVHLAISPSTSTSCLSEEARNLLAKLLPALRPLLMRRLFCRIVQVDCAQLYKSP